MATAVQGTSPEGLVTAGLGLTVAAESLLQLPNPVPGDDPMEDWWQNPNLSTVLEHMSTDEANWVRACLTAMPVPLKRIQRDYTEVLEVSSTGSDASALVSFVEGLCSSDSQRYPGRRTGVPTARHSQSHETAVAAGVQTHRALAQSSLPGQHDGAVPRIQPQQPIGEWLFGKRQMTLQYFTTTHPSGALAADTGDSLLGGGTTDVPSSGGKAPADPLDSSAGSWLLVQRCGLFPLVTAGDAASGLPVGVINPNCAICFIAVVLQVWFAIPRLRTLVLGLPVDPQEKRASGRLVAELQSIFRVMSRHDVGPRLMALDPSRFVDACAVLNLGLSEWEQVWRGEGELSSMLSTPVVRPSPHQGDPAEFHTELLTKLVSHLTGSSLGIIKDTATLNFDMTTSCDTCTYKERSAESLYVLNLSLVDLTNKVRADSVQGLWDAHWQLEETCGRRNCTGTTKTSRTITHLPEFLWLQIARNSPGTRQKNSSFVQVDEEVRISFFPPAADAQNFVYDLMAVMVHDGGKEGGHYYVIMKYGDKWVLCNDAEVSVFDKAHLQREVSGGKQPADASKPSWRKMQRDTRHSVDHSAVCCVYRRRGAPVDECGVLQLPDLGDGAECSAWFEHWDRVESCDSVRFPSAGVNNLCPLPSSASDGGHERSMPFTESTNVLLYKFVRGKDAPSIPPRYAALLQEMEERPDLHKVLISRVLEPFAKAVAGDQSLPFWVVDVVRRTPRNHREWAASCLRVLYSEAAQEIVNRVQQNHGEWPDLETRVRTHQPQDNDLVEGTLEFITGVRLAVPRPPIPSWTAVCLGLLPQCQSTAAALKFRDQFSSMMLKAVKVRVQRIRNTVTGVGNVGACADTMPPPPHPSPRRRASSSRALPVHRMLRLCARCWRRWRSLSRRPWERAGMRRGASRAKACSPSAEDLVIRTPLQCLQWSLA